MNADQVLPILYDLAMTMAGETKPHALASSMVQRLMFHTGCSCGMLILNPKPDTDGKNFKAQTYVAIGSPVLRTMEGKTQDWPLELLAAEGVESVQGWLPAGATYRYVFRLDLPDTGHILLLSTKPHKNSQKQKSLLAPIMAKFTMALQYALENEKTSQILNENEARIRDILESSPDWIWEATPHATLIYSNRKSMDLLGYPADEVIGRTFFDFMPPQEAKHIGWTFRDLVSKRQAFRNLESIFLHKDGYEIVLESSAVPILDSQDNLYGYRGVTRDITERKRDEAVLIKAKDDAKASDRAKSLFLSSMSHEFRTPLNAILGHAQLIEMQENLSQETATSAEEILQAGKVLLSLVDNVLELSRIGSGNTELCIEQFPINDLLKECVSKQAQHAASRKIRMDTVCKCDRFMIETDRAIMCTVLTQLVSNAIKYNREGGEVIISCRNPENGRARIEVKDNGTGISADEQAKLFTPFNRLHAVKGNIQGSGVGLSIARQLMESLSGAIGVESTPGKGSTFWLELPASAAISETNSSHANAKDAPSNGKPEAIRVLVAEDYPPNQNVLKIQLERLGSDVDIASNGEEALALWKRNRYHLILADLNMPVMDGLALARAVREREAGSAHHIPIICITAAAVPKELEQCFLSGMDDALAKPVALDDLRRILERWGKSGIALPSSLPPSAKAQEEAPLNLDHLYHILGETNENQARQLISTFIESADKGLAQLSLNQDALLVSREMHKLKSSARTVGALVFAKLAEALEQELKQGRDQNISASLTGLREELSRVSAASAAMQSASRAAESSPALAGYGSVMIVDDDPVVLQQMSVMIASLGARETLTAGSGREALKLLSERNAQLDALICDLNMPEMDGVELIRLFGRTGFKGGLILMSGADEKVLATVGKLAELQGLRVLGQLLKPATPSQIVSLLTQTSTQRARKRQGSLLTEVSPQAIRDGMDRDEFTLWFQPKVDAGSMKPVGVEALARWQHPGRGTIPPDLFISVAEREGLIRELSQMLVAKALMEGAKLHEAGFNLSIALNLSGLWLDDLNLPDFIFATANAARIPPRDIILEVTETGVMKDVTTALDVLTRLRLKGFGLSIDDFGIGYSSFEQLDRIPFTELKLDRSFVSKGVNDATARAILQSSMDMARKMQLSSVAEGVETEADLEMVRAMGCDRVQGYLIAKPMPVMELLEWLKGRMKDV